ncbi:FkbM family methyltransferase [Siculibacillus lacustris]|uniref:FkbM family methyltransferase n=1 Tax=Siculibacillus lacustris TaxID=1549641 RepID=A0A4Q9VTT8_9HYPH|nr:FkbM family methyltransferase [Siculibacillus lacustris]TBW39538.1 FkbM family methyltransferase [Siculibacillus lacustris]
MSETEVLALLTDLKREVADIKVALATSQRTLREVRDLVGPFGVAMPDGSMLVQTLYGIKYLIDPLDLIIGPQLIVYRQWEADLSAMTWAHAHKDMVFVDVGANFGYFTCLLGSRIGRTGSGRVYAVEPNPACIELLRKNVAINWSMAPITIHPCAVGAASTQLDLVVPKNRSANGALVGRRPAPIAATDAVYTVAVEPLDDLLPEGEVVDLIKIDVEGHEWAVLAGARKVVARSPGLRIIMEWAPLQMTSAGYTADDMVSLFDELGLDAYRQTPGFRLAEPSGTPLDRAALGALSYDNIVLAPRPRG